MSDENKSGILVIMNGNTLDTHIARWLLQACPTALLWHARTADEAKKIITNKNVIMIVAEPIFPISSVSNNVVGGLTKVIEHVADSGNPAISTVPFIIVGYNFVWAKNSDPLPSGLMVEFGMVPLCISNGEPFIDEVRRRLTHRLQTASLGC